MRPPSYYSSLASGNSEIGSKYGGNSNLSRSSFSSPTSSTYATRSHLPYVPTSMLVAHCISGASSGHSARAKPSYQATSGYSTSYSRPNSQKRYQPSTATTTPTRPSSSTSYLSPYSSSNSYHSTRLPSSSSFTPSTNYTTTRSSYLTAPGSTRTSYRPSALSTVYNYKPIRLRDRPLLTQISRQIDTKTTTPRSSRLEASSDTKASEENWDVGRNISRNKYLIKFREFDKRKDSSAELTKRVVTPDEPPIEPKVEPERESVQQEKVVVLEVEPEEKVKVESVGEEVDLGEVLESVEAEPVMKIESTVTTSELPAELPKPDEPLRPKAAPDICDADASKSVESKQPRARRNMKLKIKTRSNAPESDENADLAATKTKAKRTPPESPVVLVKPAAREKAKDKTLKKVGSSKKVKATTAVEAEPQRKALKEVQPVVAANQDAKDVVTETAEQSKDPKPPVTQPPTTVNKRIRCREYNLDDFDFISVLGHGGWGFVILAELKGHDACFAVKCIKKITIVEDDDFDSIMIERKVLTLGNLHPFICKLFCTFETPGYLFFAMEYCAGGDLMFHVQKEGKFTEARCRFYAAEIICAIRFLHNRHIIYRDLKLDNILLDATGHVRLVDFGMCQCRTYREDMLPSNFCGTPGEWRPLQSAHVCTTLFCGNTVN